MNVGWCLLGLAFLLPQWGSLTEEHAEHRGYVHPSLPTLHYPGSWDSPGRVRFLCSPPLVQRHRVKMDWERRWETCQKALNARDTGDGLGSRQRKISSRARDAQSKKTLPTSDRPGDFKTGQVAARVLNLSLPCSLILAGELPRHREAQPSLPLSTVALPASRCWGPLTLSSIPTSTLHEGAMCPRVKLLLSWPWSPSRQDEGLRLIIKSSPFIFMGVRSPEK